MARPIKRCLREQNGTPCRAFMHSPVLFRCAWPSRLTRSTSSLYFRESGGGGFPFMERKRFGCPIYGAGVNAKRTSALPFMTSRRRVRRCGSSSSMIWVARDFSDSVHTRTIPKY